MPPHGARRTRRCFGRGHINRGVRGIAHHRQRWSRPNVGSHPCRSRAHAVNRSPAQQWDPRQQCARAAEQARSADAQPAARSTPPSPQPPPTRAASGDTANTTPSLFPRPNLALPSQRDPSSERRKNRTAAASRKRGDRRHSTPWRACRARSLSGWYFLRRPESRLSLSGERTTTMRRCEHSWQQKTIMSLWVLQIYRRLRNVQYENVISGSRHGVCWIGSRAASAAVLELTLPNLLVACCFSVLCRGAGAHTVGRRVARACALPTRT